MYQKISNFKKIRLRASFYPEMRDYVTSGPQGLSRLRKKLRFLCRKREFPDILSPRFPQKVLTDFENFFIFGIKLGFIRITKFVKIIEVPRQRGKKSLTLALGLYEEQYVIICHFLTFFLNI